MVNFNFQDGYSVLTFPKGSLYHYTYDDDINSENILPFPANVDSNNIIEGQSSSGSYSNNDGLLSSASSILLVHEVQFKHAGNYSCAPSNTRPTSINVHVLKGNLFHSKRSSVSIEYFGLDDCLIAHNFTVHMRHASHFFFRSSVPFCTHYITLIFFTPKCPNIIKISTHSLFIAGVIYII